MNDDFKEKLGFYWRRLQGSGWDEILQRGMEALKEVDEARKKPNAYTVARAVMSTTRALYANDLYLYDALDRRVWKSFFSQSIKEQLLELFEKHVTSTINVTRSGDVKVYMISKPGVKIAWAKDEDTTTDICAHADCYESSVKWARDLLWKSVNPNRVVLSMSQSKNPTRGRQGGQLSISTDDLIDSAPSSMALKLSEYLTKCLEQGIGRTMLFHGPAGSGKSTITRTICETLKLRSLRIRVEDIANLGNEPVSEMISVFEPDVIIFDDLDRATSQASLFEMLELLHHKVKMVFATVNHINELDDSLRRPGRFDEIFPIIKLDESAVKKILGNYDDAFDLVKDWPVAFIKEYIVRRKILGAELALDSVKELKKRVKDLMKKYDDETGEPEEGQDDE